MSRFLLFSVAIFLFSCNVTSYYVVRHAEKESAPVPALTMMSSDVPLSEAGKLRAEALKALLKKEKIRYIFSTGYIRTKSTAQPLADGIQVPIEIYDPKDPAFISKLKTLRGNALIVGHSNTVDEMVNELAGKNLISGDLPDAAYGDLFIVRKKGSKTTFEKRHFGRVGFFPNCMLQKAFTLR